MFELLTYPFFRNAVIALLLISVATAVAGTYIVTSRQVSVAGGITHSCFGGLGLGCYLGVSPSFMAGIFAVASALGVEWMSQRGDVRRDSATGVIWAVGMALGVVFVFLTPGYVPELTSFLFGNILTVSLTDIVLYAVYTLALCTVMLIMRRTVTACAFDPDFARTMGRRVNGVNLLMALMVSLCIVLTIKLAGIMLLMSMMTLPVLAAEPFCRTYGRLTVYSCIIAVACSCIGIITGGIGDVPCSAIIVLVMAAAFGISRLTALLLSRHNRTK